jgi:hypothetical protein
MRARFHGAAQPISEGPGLVSRPAKAAAPPNPESDSAAPIPPIYRPYHPNLY